MRISECRWSGGNLILKTADVDARHFAYGFKPGEFTISPVKEKRSIDANAYAWVLIDKLAKATNVGKTDVYRRAIKEIGGNSTIVCVKTEAVQNLRKQWSSNGIGWQTEEMPSKIPGCANVILYYGSSTFDRAQMARFIDSLVQDCQAVGIETMEENNLRSLLESWNA